MNNVSQSSVGAGHHPPVPPLFNVDGAMKMETLQSYAHERNNIEKGGPGGVRKTRIVGSIRSAAPRRNLGGSQCGSGMVRGRSGARRRRIPPVMFGAAGPGKPREKSRGEFDPEILDRTLT